MTRLLEIHGLDRMKRDFAALGDRGIRNAVFGTLDDIALDANTRLKTAFEDEIEGGPSRFTEIRPGQRKSSVVENRARRRGDGVESSIAVQKLQSSYLKYALGEDGVRTPGDVGAASKHNFVPVGTSRQVGSFRLTVDRHGNLQRNTLRRLTRLAASQRTKDQASLAKKLGRDASDDEFGAFRAERKMKSRRVRRIDQRIGKRTSEGIFFGRLRRGSGTLGFWQRPPERSQKPSLLVLAVDRSAYRSGRLLDRWNAAVETAMDEMPRTLQKRLSERLRAMTSGA